MKKSKILILAQTPPPFHGQSIMQEYLVNVKWDWCEKKHIRLNYSNNISEIGKINFIKIIKLLKVILNVWQERLKGPIDIMYYPPAGPNKIPFYRDVLTLIFTRFLAKKILFHFHTGGFDYLYKSLYPIEKYLAKIIYANVDSVIVLSQFQKKELEWISAKNVYVIQNGIPDIYWKYFKNLKRNNHPIILFVGNLCEEKGVFYCLKAASILNQRGINYKFKFIGTWHSSNLQTRAEEFIILNGLADRVEFCGIMIEERKWEEYSTADIFCLPTYAYESSSVAIIEAMMFSLPVISTNWHAIPDIVKNDEEGFLITIQSAELIADKIELLIKNAELNADMGKKGRQKFLNKYTIDKHLNRMENVFKDLLNEKKLL